MQSTNCQRGEDCFIQFAPGVPFGPMESVQRAQIVAELDSSLNALRRESYGTKCMSIGHEPLTARLKTASNFGLCGDCFMLS